MTLHNKTKDKIGIITSGGFSPSLGVSIGMGYIDNNYLKTSNEIYCLIRNSRIFIRLQLAGFCRT